MRKLTPSFARPFFPLLALVAGCGSTAASSHPDAGEPAADAAVDAHKGQDAAHDTGAVDAAKHDSAADAADHGAVSTTYPAFTVDAPQISSNQGLVLKKPVIVTVTWPSEDTSAATWEAMGDAMGGSDFWAKTTSEYGVGAAVSGAANHVRMTAPLPSSIGYTDLGNYVQAAVTAAAAGASGGVDGGVHDSGTTEGGAHDAATADAAVTQTWPAPTTAGGDAQTIYSLIIPQSVKVTDPGSGASFCQYGATGYHDNVIVNGNPVAYSVSLNCATGDASVEETLAHELVEASTNPYPSTTTFGYFGYDADHAAWDLYSGTTNELADACENWADSYVQSPAPFPYWIQKSWSNAAMAAGHDPCAPQKAATPYEGLTLFPAEFTTGTLNLSSVGSGSLTTRVLKAKVGQTVTFQVGFYSDAAASAPWTIAYDFPANQNLANMTTGNPIGNGTADVAIDVTSGQNGQKANVTVTPKTAGALGFQIMAITWDPPTGAQANMYLPHYLPVILDNQ